MRMTIKRASTSKRNSNKALSKPIYHPRRAVVVLSELLMLAILLFTGMTYFGALHEQDAAAQAVIAQMKAEELARERAATELDTARLTLSRQATHERAEHTLRVALYCEAKPDNKVGMEWVASNIINRVISDEYPDTIVTVVNEKRWSSRQKAWIAMYSYIDTACLKKLATERDEAHWKMAGREAFMEISHYERTGKARHRTKWYHAEYVDPAWGKGGVASCQHVVTAVVGDHIHYDEPTAAELQLCKANKAEKARIAKLNKAPKQDDVAKVILAGGK